MNRNTISNTESSLLLQLPKSMLSFSDMSGSSFLLPVAVENVAAPETSTNSSNSEKKEGTVKQSEITSVCQLQQPLLMRRGSSPGPKASVPYSEPNITQTTHVNSQYTDVLHSRPFVQPAVSNSSFTRQTTESLNWPNASESSSVGQQIQSGQAFSGFQNQLPVMQPESNFCQLSNQERNNLGYQNIYPPQTSVPSSSNYADTNVPLMNTAGPGISEKMSDFQSVSSSTNDYYSQPPVIAPTTSTECFSQPPSINPSTVSDYFSQPPVITPSTITDYSQPPTITPNNAPTYYSNTGRNQPYTPQTAYPTNSNQNYNLYNPSIPEMYSRVYEPVRPYWLFRDIVENREVWCGFSTVDSDKLETAFQQDPQAVVPVDGGRYDAILSERLKKPVYFEAKDLQIRRCTWFYCPDSSQRYTPFPEEAAGLLEQHYSSCVTSGQWQKRVDIPGLGSVVLENPQLLLFYKNEVDLWPSLPDSKANPKPVRRGLPENFEILACENNRIDHLVFIVQGIGSFCDLRFRTVAECVDGFRDIANKLLTSHFKVQVDSGQVGRVEFLPLAWHAKLHTSDKGFDRCMQNITLPSIPKLRHFTNDTLLDILLYSSPFYCQTIIDTVASELNKLYEIFLKRNPGFNGKVFVAGHSLGSLILFDILSNQKAEDMSSVPSNELGDENSKIVSENEKAVSENSILNAYDSIASLLQACQLEEYTELFEKEKIDLSTVSYLSSDDLKNLGLPIGPCKKLLKALQMDNQAKDKLEVHSDGSELYLNVTGKEQILQESELQASSSESKSLIFPLGTSPCMQAINYPKLHFEPACFFALGSPISMFLTVRGYDSISDDFRFPTCTNFFHIFHPYDPVAFRIEPLIDPNFSAKPVLIPHHKGRKRMHLEIRENLSKVGFEIKQKVLETLRYTWNSLSGFAKAHTFPSAAVEAEVDKLVSQQMSESDYAQQAAPSETCGEEIQIGSLNGGRRIDYVLQEKPIEALNDYIFALTSHATYWDSEDTVLMILREIYATQGILVSSQSVFDNKQFITVEHSSEQNPQLKSVMSNPCFFENSASEQVSANVSTFYNQSIPPVIPSASESMHSFSNYSASSSQTTSNVPPPAPAPAPAPTAQQPLGPPPLTGFVKRSPFTR